MGNAGVQAMIDTAMVIARRVPGVDHRFRVEHAGVTSPDQWRALADLGAVAVVQPGFVQHVGEQATGLRFDGHHWLAFAGLAEAGVRLAGSSDDPCAPSAPLWGTDLGVLRRTASGKEFEPEQSLPFATWLEAYTVGAAYAGGQEAERGSISPGKLADLVVLDRADTGARVLQTWKRGTARFESAAHGSDETRGLRCARPTPRQLGAPMKALVYGVAPEPTDAAPTGNPLLDALARTPMASGRRRRARAPPARLGRITPRLTGICGSDAKQVFMDWGRTSRDLPDNPMKDFFSLPQVLGHEVVADVVELGPEAKGLEVGDRVVLNPWLSCGPRGISPVCPACEIGDSQPVLELRRRADLAPGIHIGTSKDLPGGYADADARARLDAVQGPRLDARRARGVRRPVRGVAALDHPPPAANRAAR